MDGLLTFVGGVLLLSVAIFSSLLYFTLKRAGEVMGELVTKDFYENRIKPKTFQAKEVR